MKRGKAGYLGRCKNCDLHGAINSTTDQCSTCTVYYKRTGKYRPIPSGTEIDPKRNTRSFLRKRLLTSDGQVWR